MFGGFGCWLQSFFNVQFFLYLQDLGLLVRGMGVPCTTLSLFCSVFNSTLLLLFGSAFFELIVSCSCFGRVLTCFWWCGCWFVLDVCCLVCACLFKSRGVLLFVCLLKGVQEVFWAFAQILVKFYHLSKRKK